MSTFGFTDDASAWDTEKVLKWMATLGVRPNTDIVGREQIGGAELVRMSTEDLVEIGFQKRDAELVSTGIETLNFGTIAADSSISEANLPTLLHVPMVQSSKTLAVASSSVRARPQRSPALTHLTSPVSGNARPVSELSKKLLKGRAVHYSAEDHHSWGLLHQEGAIPGTQEEWYNWYKTLDRLSADVNLWCGMITQAEVSREASDTFTWGEIRVNIKTDPTQAVDRAAKQIVEMSSLDSLYDLTPDRIIQLFTRFDKDEDGFLAIHEVGALLRHQGLAKLDNQTKAIFKALDLNNDMRLFLPEVATMLCSLKLADLVVHTDHDDLGRGINVIDFSTEVSNFSELDDEDDFQKFWFGHRHEGMKRWVHITNPTKLLLLHLTVKYQLHPLGVEDALDFVDARDIPIKFDRFGNHFYVCVTYFFLTTTHPRIQYQTASLVMFVSGAPKFDTVISMIHSGHPQPLRENLKTGKLEDVWSGIQEQLKSHHARTREHGSDYLMYEILSVCYEELKPITIAYRFRLSQFHSDLMKDKCAFGSEKLEELSSIVLELGDLHRNLRPLKHLLRQLLDDQSISKYTKMCLSNLFDDTDQVEYDIQLLRETCKSISEDYNRFNEIRLNDALGVLTVASSVFMPAQFLSGVYGMNFKYMPELDWEYSYAIFWAVLIVYFGVGGWFAWERFGNIIQNKEKSAFHSNMQRHKSFGGQRGREASTFTSQYGDASPRDSDAAPSGPPEERTISGGGGGGGGGSRPNPLRRNKSLIAVDRDGRMSLNSFGQHLPLDRWGRRSVCSNTAAPSVTSGRREASFTEFDAVGLQQDS
eukprot:TRINITY_DN2375_c0_g2_i1.p1 TRINITY_DN2375_c0_g2~~TRINITY_DN2375_c0_g2_i1.p1  ORF type:complete len:816 (+),score=260.98 TRINITY_DN2375_c0_g2_i1:152-2599(+)